MTLCRRVAMEKIAISVYRVSTSIVTNTVRLDPYTSIRVVGTEATP